MEYAKPKRKDLMNLLEKLLHEVERNTCYHEETHRGGAIWTICDACGKKWADDEGGFVPRTDPEYLNQARDIVHNYKNQGA